MRLRTFIANCFWYHWRSHLSLAVAAAVATAVLVGALALGDCVRETLRRQALDRLAGRQIAVTFPQGYHSVRFRWRDALSGLAPTTAPSKPEEMILTTGIVSRADGDKTAGGVQIIGIEDATSPLPPLAGEGSNLNSKVVVNAALATRLGIKPGDKIVIAAQKPDAGPIDSAAFGADQPPARFSMQVSAVIDDPALGNFRLQTDSGPAMNVFMWNYQLATRLHQRGSWRNSVLLGSPDGAIDTEQVRQQVEQNWRLDDAGLEFRSTGPLGAEQLELTARQIFINDDVAQAAAKASPCGGVLTWFVTELRVGDRATPYSFVSGIGPLSEPDKDKDRTVTALPRTGETPVPRNDEIWITQWLADDLAAKVGDELAIDYFTLGPDMRLTPAQAKFRVARMLPMDSPLCDRTLTPNFPGLSDAANCADWKSDLIDLRKVRKQDNEYWTKYGPTPKAIVSLAAARKMWANPLGSLTAIRFGRAEQAAVEAGLRSRLTPASQGIVVRDVRKEALEAAEKGTDFGQLYLGLSFFLLASAVGLTAMIFSLGAAARSREAGLLLAVGWRRGQVLRAMLAESLPGVILGTLAGAVAGLLYTRGMLYGLETVWSPAAGGMTFGFYPSGASIAIGASVGLAVALGTIVLTLRRQFRISPQALLAGGVSGPDVSQPARIRSWSALLAVLSAIAAIALLVLAPPARRSEAAAPFFGAASLLLISAVTAVNWRLRRPRRSRPVGGLVAMAMRGAARRPGRSLAVVIIVACATFVLAVVGANRRDARMHASDPASGTGGFALLAESTRPVDREVRVADATVLPIRLHEGDRADCLTLTRAVRPQVMGVNVAEFQRRGAFAFAAVADGLPHSWACLRSRLDGSDIPAAADENALWSMGRNLGDRIEYTDSRGRSVHLRLVGVLASSVLQGGLIVSAENFAACFPADGSRMFLIDPAAGRESAVAAALTHRLADYGLAVRLTTDRLAELEAVENSYLDIFTLLGGLGVLLGSVGLAAVVARNALERRGELAVLAAVGYTRQRIRHLVLLEHAYLLGAGAACGLVAAAVAVGPVVARGMTASALAIPLATIAILLLCGVLWTAIATAWATRGPLLPALRSE